MSGTLEGVGPNKSGITNAPAKDYGMTLNGTTSGHPGSALGPGGPNAVKARGESLVNDVFPSNDTRMVDVPEGTDPGDGLSRWGIS